LASPPALPSQGPTIRPPALAQRPDDRVTEQVTKPQLGSTPPKYRRPEPIDPETVRLERSADYDLNQQTAGWEPETVHAHVN